MDATLEATGKPFDATLSPWMLRGVIVGAPLTLLASDAFDTVRVFAMPLVVERLERRDGASDDAAALLYDIPS